MNKFTMTKFCAVEYRVQSPADTSPIILLAFEDAQGRVRILVHPNWRSFVQPEDVTYINDLLGDFLERTTENAAELFKQLTSLAVGPLVTQKTGDRISDYPDFVELCSEFVELP